MKHVISRIVFCFISAIHITCVDNEVQFDNSTLGDYPFQNQSNLHDDNETSLFNSTEVANDTENSTDATEENSITKDSNQTEPSKTSRLDFSRKYFSLTLEDICNCDLHSNMCDINCCCDSDCSEDDMKVFSTCYSQVLVPDKNYCYQTDIIFRNNTVYKMVKDPESNLFCILHDNLKRHLQYRDFPVMKTHREMDLLLNHRTKTIYSWDGEEENIEGELSELRVGTPIYVDVLQPIISSRQWNLPSSCFGQTCSCNLTVHYLENFSSSCSQIINNLKKECESKPAFSAVTYSDFCINSLSANGGVLTSLSDLISHTKNTNASDSAAPSEKLCVKKSKIEPKYHDNDDVCANVVKSVIYYLIHDGIAGVTEITAKFEFVDVKLGSKGFVQNFDVNFEWHNSTDVNERSGNPGYLIGSKILVGVNGSAGDDEDGMFNVTINHKGLTTFLTESSGLCSTAQRRSIKFGRNFRTGCFHKTTIVKCDDIQKTIFDILLGPGKNELFVGIFGNANNTNSEDWVEVHHEDHDSVHTPDSCILVDDMHIDIVYASVGTTANPQNKILGTSYHYSKTPRAKNSGSPIKLTTSVSFFDITEPAVPYYAKVPSVKASLPSDFFYPFLQGNSAECNCYVTIFIVIGASLNVLSQMTI